MARTLNSITIVTPSSDPNISEGGNFTFEVSLGYSGGGGWNTYDIKFEYDDSGVGSNWQTITAVTDLSIDTGTYTNPLLNQSDGANVIMVIDGDTIGSYDIRAVGDPSAGNDSYTVISSTQAVTVLAGSQTITFSGDPPEGDGEIDLTGKVPVVARSISVGKGTPTLAGKIPVLDLTIYPVKAELRLRSDTEVKVPYSFLRLKTQVGLVTKELVNST
jgi:hypothetical protein